MLKKEPVRGMRDIMPDEMAVRTMLLDKLRCAYSSFGFAEIETPCVESIGNLSSNNGGENEKLVFKVMKRGEKLQKALESGALEALADSGLRYDLTLPLTRYYAANAEQLPSPFKAMQIGSVWRADRPQFGRYRQFTQCDIDILGDASVNAEIELVSATSMFLKSAEVADLQVHINDRRILEQLVIACGFPSDAIGDVLIILDKYDKLGLDGVCDDLRASGYAEAAISEYRRIFEGFLTAADAISYCENELGCALPEGVMQNMRSIIEGVATVTSGAITPKLDITLVRGMGYYTGPVFEITTSELEGSSIAGGGRYDKMIGKYTGNDVAACGFSIGFERLVGIMMKRPEHALSEGKRKIAILYDKSFSAEDVAALQAKCMPIRERGTAVLLEQRKRNAKHQREILETTGYSAIVILDNPTDIESLDL